MSDVEILRKKIRCFISGNEHIRLGYIKNIEILHFLRGHGKETSVNNSFIKFLDHFAIKQNHYR